MKYETQLLSNFQLGENLYDDKFISFIQTFQLWSNQFHEAIQNVFT